MFDKLSVSLIILTMIVTIISGSITDNLLGAMAIAVMFTTSLFTLYTLIFLAVAN